MTKLLPWLLVLLLGAFETVADEELRLPKELIDGAAGADTVVSLCLLTEKQVECLQPFAVRVVCCDGAGDAIVRASDICRAIQENLPYAEGRLVAQRQPSRGLWRIGCQDPKKPKVEEIGPKPPDPAVPATGGPPKPDPGTVGGPVSKAPAQVAWRKLEERLAGMDKFLKELKTRTDALEEERKMRAGMDADQEQRLQALRKEVLGKLEALEEAQKTSCVRQNGHYGERPEVQIAVAGGVLRFLEVKPLAPTVKLGLSQAKADELLRDEAELAGKQVFPGLYRSVPEKTAVVEPFFLQDRLIDAELYARVSLGKNSRRVVYQDARRFVDELNRRCRGKAAFDLPSEEQFVAAAHRAYRPIEQGVMDCAMAAERGSEISQLFGQAWQLTRSPCSNFGEPPQLSCDKDTYIRKGGAVTSRENRLECLPEYRHPGAADIELPETSFRLVLVQ